LKVPAAATTIESVVPEDATLESLLRQQELPVEVTTPLINAIRGVFNPRDLRADRTYWVTRTIDGIFREFRYSIDADNLLRVVFRDSAKSAAAEFDVDIVTLPKEYQLAAVTAQISRDQPSLFSAFEAAGENMQLPRELSDVFGGQLDFNSDLHPGDRFDVLFDRATRNGEFVGYGDIQAAVLVNKGRKITAFRHIGADGKPSFYDEQGRPVQRSFLVSPLPFAPRVTSGFTNNRFHPVLGINRPHLGVDFGAPFGTAVFAVAEGVVEFAGWSGEAGRMVRIRHAGGYTTSYLHLSALGPGIYPGAHVTQKALIGRVGQTGTATGPHLDYRVTKNGKYINPLTAFRGLPAGETIAAADLPAFRRERDRALAELQARLNAAPSSPLPLSSSR
jgi:murein DD-endopeptidase MepM/ murein hydrolase activator NlpD